MKISILSTRIHIILVSLIALCGIVAISYGVRTISIKKSAPCTSCNVVIISLDTLEAKHLPCYGYTKNTMPNLCRFADRNIRFENAHAQSSWTFPNATSVMTGLYPSSHKMYDNILDTLHPAIPTLPKLYKQAGYHTIAVINSQETNIPFPKELTKQFDTVISTQGLLPEQEVQTWVDTLSKKQRDNKPIFLYIYTTFLGYYRSTDIGIAHTFPFDPSFTPPQTVFEKRFTPAVRENTMAFITSFKEKIADPAKKSAYIKTLESLSSPNLKEASDAFDALPQEQKIFLYQEEAAKHISLASPEDIRYIKNLYDARLSRLDTAILPILNLLDTDTYQKNTVAIIYSDHGENLGDHDVWGHATTPYDTLTHVPFLMHIPNTTATIVTRITKLMDIFPTVLSRTGLPIPTHISAHDQTSAILSRETDVPDTEFSIAQVNNGIDQSIRTALWSLLIHTPPQGKTTYHLYDLNIDKKEQTDVAQAHPDTVNTLMQTLTSAINQAPVYTRDLR